MTNPEIVNIILQKHSNADTLSIVHVGGYQCVVKTDEFDVDKGLYLPPDTMIPKCGEFAFLFTQPSDNRYMINENGECIRDKQNGDYFRVTTRKFRGEMSYGLLMPCTDINIKFKRYEPFIDAQMNTECAVGPTWLCAPTYKLQALKAYPDLIQEGELVEVTEKLHGCNLRTVYSRDELFVGSHYRWKKEDDNNIFWRAVKSTPNIIEFCRNNPDIVVYSEAFGAVQKFKYGTEKGVVKARVFDLWNAGSFVNPVKAKQMTEGFDIDWTPVVFRCEFNYDKVLEMAKGKSLIPGADHIREGVVIEPLVPRNDPSIGRIKLKLVSDAYYEMK